MRADWISYCSGKLMPNLSRVLLLAMGIAFIRVWRSWAFHFTYSYNEPVVFSFDVRDFFSIGTIIGTLVCLLIIKKSKSLVWSGGLLAGVALMTAGSVPMVVIQAGGYVLPVLWVTALVLIVSAGFALVQASWIEWLACKTIPLVTLLSCMLAWLMHAIIWTPLGSLDISSLYLEIAVIVLPLLSLGAMILDASCEAEKPDAEGLSKLLGLGQPSVQQPRSSLQAPPFFNPCDFAVIKPNLPLFVWAWVFTVAYSVGTVYSGMGRSSSATMVGELLAVCMLILAFWILGSNFDYTTIYRFTLIMLAIGFAAAAFENQDPVIIQACFSASNVTIMALATTIICAFASFKQISGAWGYSILMLGWYITALTTRTILEYTGFSPDATTILFIAMAVVVLLLLALAVSKEADLLFHWKQICFADSETTFASRCQDLAQRYNLGERETGVLVLLAQGKTYAEISELLFIALGTVRAHASHIYEKLGIHSKEELTELLEKSSL
ncbi:MAG: helix-turn-helix transcriptional regulator [Coriobacteriales bacterium]|nr:helix-turn-helix transcriptional regulator [Coriobacteriales bacterium]